MDKNPMSSLIHNDEYYKHQARFCLDTGISIWEYERMVEHQVRAWEEVLKERTTAQQSTVVVNVVNPTESAALPTTGSSAKESRMTHTSRADWMLTPKSGSNSLTKELIDD